jgi:hypothetical protein
MQCAGIVMNSLLLTLRMVKVVGKRLKFCCETCEVSPNNHTDQCTHVKELGRNEEKKDDEVRKSGIVNRGLFNAPKDGPLSGFNKTSDLNSLTRVNRQSRQQYRPALVKRREWKLREVMTMNKEQRANVYILVVDRIIPDVLADLTNLKQLTFDMGFNQPLGVGVLPDGLKQLTFGMRFNQHLDVGVLPDSLEHLTFGMKFDQPLGIEVLPDGLKQLTFGMRFNQPLDAGVLPVSLKELTFGRFFDQPLVAGVLPGSLEELTFGRFFDQPLVAGVLPGSLEELTFGRFFNQPLVAGVLPDSLKELTFGRFFNHALDADVLPTGCKIEKIEHDDDDDDW